MEAFAAFERAPPPLIDMASIPWPPKGNLLSLAGAREEDQKKRLKELFRRWHPDKWCANRTRFIDLFYHVG
jgi:hypothetical protein